MNEQPAAPPNAVKAYLIASRGPWYGFLFALPILIGYEVLVLAFPSRWINGADALLQTLISPFGAQNMAYILLGGVLLSGVLCWTFDRSRARLAGQPLKPKYFVLMFAESFVYALFLAPLVAYLMQILGGQASLQIGGPAFGMIDKLKMSLGAGIYEELVFRVMILGGLNLLLRKSLRMDALLSWVIAVAVSSLIFSLFHYIGSGADVFRLDSFVYRFLAGGVLATLFACRGFGIAVWTHALYDLIVMFLGGG